MFREIPDDISEGDDVRVELRDGYWIGGEVGSVIDEERITVWDTDYPDPVPRPDAEGNYTRHFVGITRTAPRSWDAVDNDERPYPLGAEAVYYHDETDNEETVKLGLVDDIEVL